MRVRGWQASYLGPWSGGYESEATKEFGGGQWRAVFFHLLVENEDRTNYEVRFCSTDQVRFLRRDGAIWSRTGLADVPPLVFSEAMRDVDLFVGVTSIAADPQWADRGEDRFMDYWQTTTFGDLTASAEVRRDVLQRIVSRTKLAAVASVDGRFLRIKGSHRDYKIHLGSANILMEPNDAYLCIVPGGKAAPKFHLPFDEDPVLSVILSKAFLLAADDKITDQTILRQLSR